MTSAAELILRKAAEDGSLDPAEWPQALQYILDRLDEIIDDFPKPPHPHDPSSSSHTPARIQAVTSSQESQTGDKENAVPATPPRPPVPAFTNSEANSFPQETINFYSSIRHSLSTTFAKDAPHTIQRLAELILEPKQRYRFLPPYLKALDRVVSVSSPNSLFPLPQAVLPTAPGLLNGTTTPTPQTSSLGSDESLGGALLTPIPWLQNRGAQNELISESTEIVDGPNGAGRIETVSVGMMNGNGNGNSPTQPTPSAANGVSQIASSHPDGETLPSTGPVTQGQILRQEQEAGIVLNNPHSLTSNPSRTTMGEMEEGGTVMETVEGEEEAVHARGPELIGMEDTGPQKSSAGGLDIEGAVGRPSIERRSKSPNPPVAETKDEEMKDASQKSQEEDKMVDEDKADENPDEEMKIDG
ncbi:hypothetical protein K458DRAFT_392264 [Lentithecium fluviatile CBS 122367]|uniref:PPP4R2-domain-containing protein n=1 Tax=Lentithecium fluviatile CBS 122367 TaxID=1168545 RepID=A0A6G1ISS2_9PLEO|nr:hypothetical protein K458DRAFT_392264 [Lentithecium fluviatile CBS 122367]